VNVQPLLKQTHYKQDVLLLLPTHCRFGTLDLVSELYNNYRTYARARLLLNVFFFIRVIMYM